jgi:hypothetical protein
MAAASFPASPDSPNADGATPPGVGNGERLNPGECYTQATPGPAFAHATTFGYVGIKRRPWKKWGPSGSCRANFAVCFVGTRRLVTATSQR